MFKLVEDYANLQYPTKDLMDLWIMVLVFINGHCVVTVLAFLLVEAAGGVLPF